MAGRAPFGQNLGQDGLAGRPRDHEPAAPGSMQLRDDGGREAQSQTELNESWQQKSSCHFLVPLSSTFSFVGNLVFFARFRLSCFVGSNLQLIERDWGVKKGLKIRSTNLNHCIKILAIANFFHRLNINT